MYDDLIRRPTKWFGEHPLSAEEHSCAWFSIIVNFIAKRTKNVILRQSDLRIILYFIQAN